MMLSIRTAALAAAVAATPAAATEFNFELTGEHRAVWTIDSSQPTVAYAPGEMSRFADVYGNFSDLPSFTKRTDYVAFIEFYTEGLGGGFFIEDFYGRTDPTLVRPSLLTDGPAVITGDTSAPTFLPGTYFFTDAADSTKQYRLVISVVPEPASWALMIAGFAAVGAALRRRVRPALAQPA